ncbi:MAG: peptidylprolyl isomerase [Bacteroidetes bacterium]|nr:peptidylprolyl isomerase [Bacteroidota bacterium]
MRYILLAVLLVAGSCAGDEGPKDFLVTISTPMGEMYAILYDETPRHKENFIKLAKEGFFNETLFHRVIQEFMIQGGDPDSRDAAPDKQLGNGGPGYTVPAEFRPGLIHERGALSAARLGDQVNPEKASSGSQFYIVQGKVWKEFELDQFRYDQEKMMSGMRRMFELPQYRPLLDTLNELYASGNIQAYTGKIFSQVGEVEKFTGEKIQKEFTPEQVKTYTTIGGSPHLDGGYTVFGKVIGGLEVIDNIAAVSKNELDRPLENIPMEVSVEEVSRKKIEARFGYVYPTKP